MCPLFRAGLIQPCECRVHKNRGLCPTHEIHHQFTPVYFSSFLSKTPTTWAFKFTAWPLWGVLEIDGIDLCSNASSNFGRYQWRVGFGHRFCLVMMLGFFVLLLPFYDHRRGDYVHVCAAIKRHFW